MWRVLVKRGRQVGRHRMARLMRHDGLRAKMVTKWRVTTHLSHQFPVSANQLNRQFTVAAPNQVWAGDLTYIWTLEGWLYLAVLLDLYSRAMVGWAMGARLTGELTQEALQMALQRRQPKPACSTIRIVSMRPSPTNRRASPSACLGGGIAGTTPVDPRLSVPHRVRDEDGCRVTRCPRNRGKITGRIARLTDARRSRVLEESACPAHRRVGLIRQAPLMNW
ncbi:MAG: Transposase [Nitrospira sp.]|jgi:hypothetical protein|nr:MAG: Transposase [Nitrospira sp.]